MRGNTYGAGADNVHPEKIILSRTTFPNSAGVSCL